MLPPCTLCTIPALLLRQWATLPEVRQEPDAARGDARLLHLAQVYWGCHQRFFKQLIVSMKVDLVVAEAKAALAQGFAVVIGLQQTGEVWAG